jgi:predicted DNA-binding transcriptional regulator YafY
MTAGRIDRTERLLNLVVCLMSTRFPVSRERIVEMIPGYAQAPSISALERMFERDKDELRTLGIPIETVLDSSGDVEGYRIPSDRYQMEPVKFTADERAAIAVAARVWQEAILGPVANQAVRKIQAVSPGPDIDFDRMPSAHLNASDAAVLMVMRAIRSGCSVRMQYQGPQDERPRTRELDPWGIVAHEGAWYLVGFDHGRAEPRVFRTSRIVGSVTVTAQAQSVPRPENEDIRRRVRREPHEKDTAAVIRVQAGSGGGLRLLADEPSDSFAAANITVRSASEDLLVSQISAAGASAEVISPDAIRDAVRTGLERTRDRHMAELT